MLSVVPVSGLPLTVALAVLGSAVIHAGWNAIAKAIPQRLAASALMGVGYLIFGGLWIIAAPLPAAASWPYLAASVVLQTGYLLLLTAAYANGEFRQVYPIARGTAPVLVTAFALAVLGEQLSTWQLIGICLVVAALGILVAVPRPRRGGAGGAAGTGAGGGGGTGAGGAAGTGAAPGAGIAGDDPAADDPAGGMPANGKPAGRDTGTGRLGILLAVATGVVIAAYTVVDGLGVRRSGSAAGYAAWLMLLQGPLLVVVCAGLARPRRLIAWIRGGGAKLAILGLVGGGASVAAYAIVLWAQDRASLALVSALRETSVLAAGIIGTVFFAERFSRKQTLAAIGVVAGIVLMQLSA